MLLLRLPLYGHSVVLVLVLRITATACLNMAAGVWCGILSIYHFLGPVDQWEISGALVLVNRGCVS